MIATTPPAPRFSSAVQTIAEHFKISPLVAQILVARVGDDLAACERFVQPSLSASTDLPGVREAMDIILHAIEKNQTIVVFGDYDVDGLTATTLLSSVLQKLGAHVIPMIPTRDEGYGLTACAVERILREAPADALVITVDCGISDIAACKALREAGHEVVVTDHHMPGAEVPDVAVIVNPRYKSCPGAEALSGCGVAFKLADGLLQRSSTDLSIDSYRDLLTLSIVADCMPLTGDNRAFVKAGLPVLFTTSRPGLHELMRDVAMRPPTVETISFNTIPQLNAAGRMGQVMTAFDLLTTDDPSLAADRALRLRDANTQRKALEREQLDRLVALYHDELTAPSVALVLGGQDLNIGIIGIIATRLSETYKKSIALTLRNDVGGGHGSVRTYNANAVAALEACSDLLETFGGHVAAAGFSLKADCYDAFCKRFPEAIAAQDQIRPAKTQADAELEATDLSLKLLDELEAIIAPFGPGNPKPIFSGCVQTVVSRPCGAQQNHQWFQLRFPGSRDTFKGIWFSIPAEKQKLLREGTVYHATFTLAEDNFRNERQVQLQIIDMEALS